MENFERVANEIIAYINSNESRLMEAITMHGSRFILFGPSGSGKTRAIELANKQLSADQQIAESNDMLFCKDFTDAEAAFYDKDLAYQGARHIGFSVVTMEIVSKIQGECVKIFSLKSSPSRLA